MNEVPNCAYCGRPANPSYQWEAGGELCHWCHLLIEERERLLAAIRQHIRATELGPTDKGAWSKANAALYRLAARLQSGDRPL